MQKGTLTEFSVLVLSSLKYSSSAKTFNVLLGSQNCDPVKLRDLNTNKQPRLNLFEKTFCIFFIQMDAIATDYQPVLWDSYILYSALRIFSWGSVLGFSSLLRPKFNLICIDCPQLAACKCQDT